MALSPTKHQTYQPLPDLSSPLVAEGGVITPAWYRVFVTLLKRTGCIGTGAAGEAGVPSAQNGVVLGQAQGPGLPIAAYNAANGALLGYLQLGKQTGLPAQGQVPGTSPFVFAATLPGVLVTDSGKVEISRDVGATFFLSSLVGGATSVLVGDWVRVSWTKAIPSVVFLPVGGLG